MATRARTMRLALRSSSSKSRMCILEPAIEWGLLGSGSGLLTAVHVLPCDFEDHTVHTFSRSCFPSRDERGRSVEIPTAMVLL
jgi:hypothetical protein